MPSRNFVHIARKQDIKETSAGRNIPPTRSRNNRIMNRKTKRVNTAEIRRNKRQSKSEESSYASSEEKRRKGVKNASEYQITQVTIFRNRKICKYQS